MNSIPNNLTLGIELIDDPAWMGGTLYLRNLVICLARLPAKERPQVRLLGPPGIVSRFLGEWGHLPIFAPQGAETLVGRLARRWGWRNSKDAAIDVVYPGFGAQISGAVTMRWVPDFQHRYLPHLFSAQEIAARDRSIGDIAARPGVVVFSSEVAWGDFRRFFPNHTAMPRVWHFRSLLDTTPPPAPGLRNKYGLPEKYLYLPNQFWAHKNHITVLRALARLRREQGLHIPLVCTGAQADRRNETHFAGLLHYINEQELTGQVHLLGLIERREQVEVLRHAAAVVQPSLFEGWSTVVEDVRATGRAIFLSDIPVHREQALNRGVYFVPESDEQLASLLSQQWGSLTPGPDPLAEETARQALDLLILDSAREFVAIAQTAVSIKTR